jgi:serine/threonine-protein kinase
MARVYRALDTQLERTVALKVMASQLNADPEFARRFQREAVLAANLRHPAIVTVYDVGEHAGLRYIAMEFIEGQSLHTIVRQRGALDLGYAAALLRPVSEALDYAHTQGAVHRDVKPHNIMIDIHGRVLLTDFGIAQPPDAEREGLTRTGVFMGTPEYISPEQAEGERVQGTSDLYSLAVVAYEIITGKVPFTGNTPQLIIAHIQQPPPLPETLPVDVRLVLQRALAKQPDARYRSGDELVSALAALASEHAIPIPAAGELAALISTPQSSAGRPTIAVEEGGTPMATHPPTLARAAPAAPAPPAAPTAAGSQPAPPAVSLPSYKPDSTTGHMPTYRPVPPPAPRRTPRGPSREPRASRTPRVADDGDRLTVRIIMIVLAVLIVVGLLSYLFQDILAAVLPPFGQPAEIVATATVTTAPNLAQPERDPTEPPEPTSTASDTPEPTSTRRPTGTPDATSEPPTATEPPPELATATNPPAPPPPAPPSPVPPSPTLPPPTATPSVLPTTLPLPTEPPTTTPIPDSPTSEPQKPTPTPALPSPTQEVSSLTPAPAPASATSAPAYPGTS